MQVRFRDVFNQYDSSRRGALSPRDLFSLIRDVTPGATAAQAKYFAVRVLCMGTGGHIVPSTSKTMF